MMPLRLDSKNWVISHITPIDWLPLVLLADSLILRYG